MSHKIFRLVSRLFLVLAVLGSGLNTQPVRAAGPWYVTPTGNDNNDCLSPGTACATINGAIGKASSSDTILISVGTYTGTGTEVVFVNKDIALSGGWDASFATQNGFAAVDGQNSMRGVMVNSGVNASMDRFIVKNGFVLDYGGGIYSDGNLSIANSSIHDNSIGNSCYGGGIFFNGDILTLNNTTIGNNAASCNGGGVFSSSSASTVTINNSTISNNKGGGVYNNGIFNLKNTIISGNAVEDCNGGSYTSQGNNIIGSTASCNIIASTGDQFNVDPLLSTFLSTQGYYPLLPGSPAIDAGNPATCLVTDQRGVTRPQGATCDIGAYEFTTPGAAANAVIVAGDLQRTPPNTTYSIPFQVVVLDSQGTPVDGVSLTFTAPSSGASGTFADTGTNTTTANTDPGGFATASAFTANSIFGAYTISASGTGFGSLNFNLENAGWYVAPTGNDANSCSQPASPCATINAAFNKPDFLPGDTILVAEGSDTSPLTLSKSLNLSGGWNDTFIAQIGFSTIDGQNTSRGVMVNSGVNASMDRFIVKNGFVLDYGGGIYSDGDLSVTNSSIHDNSIGNSCYGGGVFFNGSVLSIENTTVGNNSAGCNGGGVFSSSSSSTVTINNSTISNNNGGGVFNNGTFYLKNTIISGNTIEDCSGTSYTSQGNNIISSTSGCDITASASDQFNVNPQLETFLPAFGYFPLSPGSPAINAGNNATCLNVDQRGVTRPQGSTCDIGAIEFEGQIIPPANDNFADAEAITTLPFNATVNVNGAGIEPGEPQQCSNFGRSAWYIFNPTETMSVRLDTTYNVNVYTALGPGFDNLSFQGCTYDSNGSFQFMAEVGQTYYLQADGIGAVQINLEQILGTVNDDFDSAITVGALPFSDTRDTSTGTSASDDPVDCYNNGSVWYQFTASSDQAIGANTFGSDYDTTLAVYTGSRGALEMVPGGCNDDFSSLQSRVDFNATAGTTYYFMVGFCCGNGGTGGGNLIFSVEETTPPSTEVTIDIKPGSQTNPINMRSSGKIPVAILSTPDFNAVTEIDRTSLTFGSTGDEHSLVSCNKRGTDVNGDGLKDLVCHFKTKLTGFQLGDTEGILRGLTLGGVTIEARDVVRVLYASYP